MAQIYNISSNDVLISNYVVCYTLKKLVFFFFFCKLYLSK